MRNGNLSDGIGGEDLFLKESLDLLVGAAVFIQEIGRVLPHQGGLTVQGGGDVVHGDRLVLGEADGGHGLLGGGAVQILHRNNIAVFQGLGIGQDLSHVLDALVGNVG